MIKMMVVVLTALLSSVYTAPINNSTIIISDYSYCNETSSTSTDALHILYDDLDNTLDVLGEVCLSYDEIVSSYLLSYWYINVVALTLQLLLYIHDNINSFQCQY